MNKYGETLPEGWCLDEDVNPTVDPAAAVTMLPFAGARGYGLGLVSSFLAGPLSGGRTALHKTRALDVEGSEHFFYVIDIEQFADKDKFYDEVESTIADIRALAPAEGFDRVAVPGELEWERAQEAEEAGISLHEEHVADLESLAGKLKVDVPW